MKTRPWIVVAALVAAVGVALGAFGAHALEERLAAAGQTANWETGVRYQMWHALALGFVALVAERRRVSSLVGWAFLIGVFCFSGSLYLLALEIGKGVVWPFTPLGGTLMIVGWITLAIGVARGGDEA